MYRPRTDLAALSESILRRVTADESELQLIDAEDLYLRSADNDVTTNGLVSGLSATLSVSFGKRSASITINQVDAQTIADAVKKVEAMARLAPEDPEFMPLLVPPSLPAPPTWAEASAALGPQEALALWQPVTDACRSAKVKGASFLQRVARTSAYANSRGGYVEEKSTRVDFSLTARTDEGRGSGWASIQATDAAGLDLTPIGERAIEKALASRNATEHPAGRTTVVLEAAAVRDLLSLLSWGLNRRQYDEGQSFLNSLVEKDTDPLGQKLFSEKATLLSDPYDEHVPCSAYAGVLGREKTKWIDQGVLRHLPTGRFWADKKGISPVPWPGNLIFPGEGKTSEELIAMVENGVLVTRFWYLRLVRPDTLLYTGLTRDGTFAIRDGKLTGPINNFRFNESPAKVLKNIVATGKPERVLGSESQSPVWAPAMVVKDFNFSSVSDAS